MQVQLSVFPLVLSHQVIPLLLRSISCKFYSTTRAIINQALTSYTYIVDPSQPPVTATSSSNTVTTAVVDASLSVIKNTDSLVQSTDGTITYTVVVQNSGNTTANTVTLTDSVPEGTAFIPNSVNINGVSAPGADPNVGISLNSIAPSEIVTVTFKLSFNPFQA